MLTIPSAAPAYAGASDFAERTALLKRLCEGAGLRLPTTRLPEGTALVEYGEQKKRQLQAEVSALPDVMDALRALQARLALEAPLDRECVLPVLRMDAASGGLHNPAKGGVPMAYNDTGFQHVASFLKPATIRNGFAENMLALPSVLRAEVFNHWAKTSARAEPVTMRTLRDVQTGRRFVRAVTSSKHSLATGDDGAVCDALTLDAESFQGAKARVTREADRSEFEIIWPMMARQLVVGDVALGGVRITNSETKAGALRVECFLLRVLCLNFTTAYTDDSNADEITIRHVGDLRRAIPRALARALTRIDPFVKAFADAYAKPLPRETRAESLEYVAKKYALPERTVTSAAALWGADGAKGAGDTLAGLVNALTRASQAEHTALAADIERAAGRIAVGA